MKSWVVAEFNKNEGIANHRVFTQSVHSSDIWTTRVYIIQNGRQLLVIVMFELESAFDRDWEAAKNCNNSQTFLLNGHYADT